MGSSPQLTQRPYESTRVWRAAFSDLSSLPLQTLASQYGNAWDRACTIAARIKDDAQGLTLHDERHFVALWEALDLLVGTEIELNPVEVFVLGIAILIHDAAHTTLAFHGGFAAVSQTPEWTDNVATLLGDDAARGATLDPVQIRAALFATVRALHAAQAEKVLSVKFQHPSLDLDMHLLDDPTLRGHMGGIIGRIAASHHWDIAKVARMPKSLGVVSPYHSIGPIRPVLLAALMRAADGIQIDGHRAPDFEFATTNPQDVSRDHWTAQNRLAKGVDPDDRTALRYNSTHDFAEADAAAWWVGFDLATTADRELRTTNALLRDLGMPMLALTRVRDIDEPERFAQHVRTTGWHPIRADIKVGDTGSLIELLGGKGLYGDDVMVPLRELIQNAVDAVRARRLLEPGYEGRVRVELRQGKDWSNKDGYWLSVADDGIGMSTAILVGPFLTFGESGWSSDSLKAERPGFIGRGFRHIGRYGIGFFSVFMYSREVEVTSRQYDAGLAATRRLQFRSGLDLRPLLQDAPAPTSQVVTEVKMFLDEATAKQVLWARDDTTVMKVGEPLTKRPAAWYTMSELLGVICPAIDVEMAGWDDFSSNGGTVPPNWTTEQPLVWLERLSGFEELPKVVRDNAAMMTLIGSPEQALGRAALSPAPGELGAYTVGGLANKRTPGVVRAKHFFGTIDRAPTGPRRDPLWAKSPELSKWASEQAVAWRKVTLTPDEQNQIAVSACFFDGDPGLLANARVDREWKTLEELFALLEKGITLLMPVFPASGRDKGWQIMGRVNLQSGFVYDDEDVVVERKHILTSAGSGGTESEEFWAIPDEGWPRPFGLVGTLGRYGASRGRTLLLEGENMDFGYYNGPTIRRMGMLTGTRLVLPAFKMFLEPKA